MILVDVNVLLAAKMSSYGHHEAARRWLDDRLNAVARVGMPWLSLLGFVRLASNPRVFSRPLSVHEGLGQVQEWLELDNVWIPEPTCEHAAVLARLAREAGASARLVSDLHLAALAVEHGLVVCSRDRDFARFPGLRWEDPLGG